VNSTYLLAAVGTMALVTYLPRFLPLAIFRKKIKNPFIRSFLFYMPYGILAAMIIPSIFFSTASVCSAVCGTIAAFILAYKKLGLLSVAFGACATVFLVELFMRYTNLL